MPKGSYVRNLGCPALKAFMVAKLCYHKKSPTDKTKSAVHVAPGLCQSTALNETSGSSNICALNSL